jgi:hypothetical protein
VAQPAPATGPGVAAMNLERIIRKLLVSQRDVNAVRRGKVGRRVARRVYGKVTGRLARKLFG